jgi:hypothetical protein
MERITHSELMRESRVRGRRVFSTDPDFGLSSRFAGAWTLVNMHEVGIVSGFSAAYQLGAPYPFKDDEECARLFRLYLLLAHMSRMRGEDRKGFFS